MVIFNSLVDPEALEGEVLDLFLKFKSLGKCLFKSSDTSHKYFLPCKHFLLFYGFSFNFEEGQSIYMLFSYSKRKYLIQCHKNLLLCFLLRFLLFKRFYLFIFRQRGWEGERKGKKHQRVVASHRPPTEDLCPDGQSNQQRFGSKAST